MTIESLTLVPCCLEKIEVRKKGISSFKLCFRGFFWLKSGKICWHNDHTYLFIASGDV